jgi:hypothetical protein
MVGPSTNLPLMIVFIYRWVLWSMYIIRKYGEYTSIGYIRNPNNVVG